MTECNGTSNGDIKFFMALFQNYNVQFDYIIELVHKIYKIQRNELQVVIYELIYEILYEKNKISIKDFLALENDKKRDITLQFCRRIVECFKHKINGQKEDELYVDIIQYLTALGVYYDNE